MSVAPTFNTLVQLLSRLMPAYPVDFWQLDTELFGALPEFDSMTIVTLIGELEDTFDIVFDDEDINAENFETITSLAMLIDQRVSC